MTRTKPKLIWAEDVAALLNVSPRTVRKMLRASRHAHDTGTVRPRHLPLPVDTVTREVERGGDLHAVTARSPRWRESDITSWRRPGRGAPGVARKSAES